MFQKDHLNFPSQTRIPFRHFFVLVQTSPSTSVSGSLQIPLAPPTSNSFLLSEIPHIYLVSLAMTVSLLSLPFRVLQIFKNYYTSQSFLQVKHFMFLQPLVHVFRFLHSLFTLLRHSPPCVNVHTIRWCLNTKTKQRMLPYGNIIISAPKKFIGKKKCLSFLHMVLITCHPINHTY